MRQEIENFEVSRPHQGGQGLFGEPQVPLPGRGDEIWHVGSVGQEI